MSQIHVLKKEIFHRLYYSLLPFRIWNHVFLCCRSQYERNMCLFCTKICLKDKKVIKAICETLKFNCFDCLPPALTDGVLIRSDVNLFVLSSSHDRQKLYNPNNFGTLFCEVISSPLLLWKFYLDILSRLVFNYCDKFILPAVMSGFHTNECRRSNACTIYNCFCFKKVREVVFLYAVKLSKRLAIHSNLSVDESFIKKVFSTYKRGSDFYNPYLSIERCEKEKKDE